MVVERVLGERQWWRPGKEWTDSGTIVEIEPLRLARGCLSPLLTRLSLQPPVTSCSVLPNARKPNPN